MRYADALAALESALRFGLNPSLDGIRAAHRSARTARRTPSLSCR